MFAAMDPGRHINGGARGSSRFPDDAIRSAASNVDANGSASNGRSSYHVHFPDEREADTDIGWGGPLDILWSLVSAGLATVCLGGMGTILVVLYVTVRPFSQCAYRRLAAQLGAAAFLDAMALLLPNTKIYLTGDSDAPSPVGTSILVSNHLVDGDWWAILMLGRCTGLRGSIKVFLRNEYLQINKQGSSGNVSPTSRSSYSALANAASPSPAISRLSEGSGVNLTHRYHVDSPQDLALFAKLLHLLLEFPILNDEDYISDREQLFQLLRSFADNYGTGAPVHLLFFPEGWSLHNGADRRSILAKSNAFAQREGRPQLKHLLLPRTRGFNASLECLRESSPVVYDVTMVRSFSFLLLVVSCHHTNSNTIRNKGV
jgi:hypothetical protein